MAKSYRAKTDFTFSSGYGAPREFKQNAPVTGYDDETLERLVRDGLVVEAAEPEPSAKKEPAKEPGK